MRSILRDTGHKNRDTVTETENLNDPEPFTPERTDAPDDVSLLDLLIVVGRRKKFLAASTLVVATLALIVTLLIPKRFTATTTVLPPQQGSSLSAALLSQVGNLGPLASLAGGSLGLKNPADMTISLLKSRSVEDAMIERFDLTKLYKEKRLSDARKTFEEHCSIDSN